jgi:hypothetical protein
MFERIGRGWSTLKSSWAVASTTLSPPRGACLRGLSSLRSAVAVGSTVLMLVGVVACGQESNPDGNPTTKEEGSVVKSANPDVEYQAALTATRDWIVRNPDGWTLDLERDNPLVRPEWSEPCSENPDGGLVTLRYGDAGAQEAGKTTEIDLGFRCPIGAGAAVGDLAGAFDYAALHHLPHGITAPNWTFEILTPVSGFNEGVAFTEPAAGRVLVTIDTPMFAVYGHSTRPECKPPADASTPEGCYLELEHRIPLRIDLAAPISGTELG